MLHQCRADLRGQESSGEEVCGRLDMSSESVCRGRLQIVFHTSCLGEVSEDQRIG